LDLSGRGVYQTSWVQLCSIMLLYADDVVLVAHDAATLQQQLDAVSQFCTDWDMSVNLVKTKIVSFGTTPHSEQAHTAAATAINGCSITSRYIQQVDSYKYLGVTFHVQEGIMQAPSHLAEAGWRALFAMQKQTRYHQ
jgi:hypothetical protein